MQLCYQLKVCTKISHKTQNVYSQVKSLWLAAATVSEICNPFYYIITLHKFLTAMITLIYLATIIFYWFTAYLHIISCYLTLNQI